MIRQTLKFASFLFLSVSMTVGLAAAAQSKAKTGDPAKGKEAVESNCTVCHNVDTDDKKMGPSLKGLFKRKTLVNGKPVNDKNVLEMINNGSSTGMPPFADQLSADDKANILAYLHTL